MVGGEKEDKSKKENRKRLKKWKGSRNLIINHIWLSKPNFRLIIKQHLMDHLWSKKGIANEVSCIHNAHNLCITFDLYLHKKIVSINLVSSGETPASPSESDKK